MLIIRLQRTGKKKFPTYRLIISEKTKDTKGTYLELLGTFNPHLKENQLILKTDRVKYWLSKGAQMSATVSNLFIVNKIIEGKKRKSVFISKRRAVKITEKNKAKTEAAEKAKAEAEAKKAAEVEARAAAEAKAAEDAKAADLARQSEAAAAAIAKAKETPVVEAPAEVAAETPVVEEVKPEEVKAE